MESQTPTIGRIVHYALSQFDIDQIDPADRGNSHAGAIVPAVIVAVWSPTTVNLRLLLDGRSTPWVTSRFLGDSYGEWRWPERA